MSVAGVRVVEFGAYWTQVWNTGGAIFSTGEAHMPHQLNSYKNALVEHHCRFVDTTVSSCIRVQLFVVENCVDDWRIALSWRAALQITVELLVCSVHPMPGTSNFTTWDALNDSRNSQSVVRVPMDVLLSLPMFLRLYLVSRGKTMSRSHSNPGPDLP